MKKITFKPCKACEETGGQSPGDGFCDSCRHNWELMNHLMTCPVCNQVDEDGLEACSTCYNATIGAAHRAGKLKLKLVPDPDIASPVMQKTFFMRAGDIAREEHKLNEWLAKMADAGFEVLSRDQLGVENPGEVYITYTMTKTPPDPPEVEALQRQLQLMQLAFKHKEDLIGALGDLEQAGAPITWEALLGHLKRRSEPPGGPE